MSNRNLRYVNAKCASEIKLAGVTVTFDTTNDALRGVYLRDEHGNRCRIVIENYSNLYAQVPAPPKTEKMYVLRGEVPAIGPIARQFSEKFEAEDAKREIESAVRGDLDLSISCEEVVVEAQSAPKLNDDIPF